jgi:hypothetical protein
METCFNYCSKDHGFFSSDERRFITKIHKLKERFPDEVRIIAEPENNDGCIYCELPVEWLKVQPPKKMNLTDEKRAELSARMRRIIEDGSVHEQCKEK